VAGGLAAVAVTPAAAATVTDPASYVNPMIGTGNGGAQVGSVNEFPGPDAPFGMIQWGPDTGPTGTTVGYYYDDTTIDGFSLTRLSGVGCNIFEDFRFLPTTQAVTTSPGTSGGWDSYTSGFSHSQESAKAGYYSVTTANGIQTQLTTATRAALGQFTYPAGSPATMLINASSSSSGNDGSTLQITSPDTITGSATGGEFCGHTTDHYTVYFTVTFDQPFASYGTWEGSTATPGSTSVSGTAAGGWVTFDTSASQTINARVAISYVSVAGAESNLATVGSKSFAAAAAQAYQEWNQLLSKIEVSGGTAAQETTFYTALYHSLLGPTTYSDADGQYMGFDFKVHTVPPGHVFYTNFSSWDIYRDQVPLLAMLVPRQTSDMMQSLVEGAQQGGWLPAWATANVYTGMMGGDSADPIIAEAYAFGARDFNVSEALRYMLKGADDTTGALGQGVYAPRDDYIEQPAWGDYLQEGYVPTGSDSSAFGTSLTEEFALDDSSISQFAAALGDRGVAATFAQRGQNWQNVLDPGTGLVMPRGPEATGLTGNPAVQTDGFEEGDADQYTWMVPQNLSGLFTALGGNSAVDSQLDSFFTQLNAGSTAPYDWQGNEVTLDAPWEYDYAGQPWQTQNVVREIMTQLYSPTPGGEPGNDDLGAMSSWYVWGALGLYPETPGTSALVLGSPLFPHTVIHLGDGRTLTINAPQAAADAPYVQSLTVNGRTSGKNYLSASQYADGGTLDYGLGTTPDTSRGTSPQDAPPSDTQGEAPAIGFTSPSDGVTATRGTTTTVQVAAQSENSRPETVHWSATVPSGVHVTPSSGTLTLKPGQQAEQPVAVTVTGSSVPAGQYPVPVSYTQAGHQISTASLYVQVPPLLTVTADEPNLDLAAGGQNQATYTITNNQVSAPVEVSLAGQGPPGVSAALSASSAQVPAGGSVKVTAAFTNPSITSGSGTYTLTTSDAPDGVTLTSSTELHFTSDLALNAYGTPFPVASASSSQSGYPPSQATDGSTSTWWVSGGPAPSASSPAVLEDNFGAPVTVGSVTMTPRPGYGPTNYTIQASTDGQNWTTVGTVTSAASSGATTTTVTPTTAQYIRLVMTGTYQGTGLTVQIEELAIAAPPPEIAVAASEQNLDLGAGGWNQATYTVTNNSSATANVTLAGQAPAGVTATLSPATAQIPAGGSVQVTATFGNASASTGTGAFELTATNAADGFVGAGYTDLYFTSDMALNTFGTPFPVASATSSQGPYPPSQAIDGNTSTYWVSGGPSPTPSTPIEFSVNFGAPVTIGSVVITPRPGYGPTAYTIEVSGDGQNWTTVATVADAVNGVSTTTLTPVTAQYLRLVMTGTYQGSGDTVQIAELDVSAP
jgi:predicted alpha-1,2-mannosidase